jgi:hypothetical protein
MVPHGDIKAVGEILEKGGKGFKSGENNDTGLAVTRSGSQDIWPAIISCGR